MTRKYAQLLQIDHGTELSGRQYDEFLFLLQNALLLALKEHAVLNFMQYRYAEQSLKHQKIMQTKRKIEDHQ